MPTHQQPPSSPPLHPSSPSVSSYTPSSCYTTSTLPCPQMPRSPPTQLDAQAPSPATTHSFAITRSPYIALDVALVIRCGREEVAERDARKVVAIALWRGIRGLRGLLRRFCARWWCLWRGGYSVVRRSGEEDVVSEDFLGSWLAKRAFEL